VVVSLRHEIAQHLFLHQPHALPFGREPISVPAVPVPLEHDDVDRVASLTAGLILDQVLSNRVDAPERRTDQNAHGQAE
jgi:hypothetical protein